MRVKAGEILVSRDGQYYRVTEVEENSISLMRVGGQTVFSCRPAYLSETFQPCQASVSAERLRPSVGY